MTSPCEFSSYVNDKSKRDASSEKTGDGRRLSKGGEACGVSGGEERVAEGSEGVIEASMILGLQACSLVCTTSMQKIVKTKRPIIPNEVPILRKRQGCQTKENRNANLEAKS